MSTPSTTPAPAAPAGEADALTAARREAQQLRARLRAAEAEAESARASASDAAGEVAGLRARLAGAEGEAVRARHEDAVVKLVGDRLYAPRDLLLVAGLDCLRGADGEVSAERVDAAVEAVLADRPHWSGHRVAQLEARRDELLEMLGPARLPLVSSSRPAPDPLAAALRTAAGGPAEEPAGFGAAVAEAGARGLDVLERVAAGLPGPPAEEDPPAA